MLLLSLILAFLLPTFAYSQSNEANPGNSSGLVCEQLQVFVRNGCPYCNQAKLFLTDLQQKYPELQVLESNVETNPAALAQFVGLNEARRIRQPGVPTFSFCGEILVGFSSREITGTIIERVLTGEQETIAEGLTTNLPVLGNVNPSVLGLPLFTVIIGLVDGFNPCAMWILLFLLSLLVHVKQRSRIIMVAGTFVMVSGLVYFAFMAAWFNVFLLIGFSRALQLLLGAFAVLIGVVHVKDFFLLGRGFSLSIPEGVKPSIYERARRVVQAENLGAAMAGVTVIAILVNFVELLCTAGLPALYTQVLTYYPLSMAGYYGYLLLYNLAYIVDDALMVTLAVVTLRHHKLQENQGRWLKLISGSVILLLGSLLIFAPNLLVF